jgi:hypothetical protein
MNKKLEAYGVSAVDKSETKLALRTHVKTFKKLADM